MNLENLIVSHVDSLSIDNTNIPIKEVHINAVNEFGYKYVDIYCIVKHKETGNQFKMKIRIEDSENMTFSFLTDEEYENGTK